MEKAMTKNADERRKASGGGLRVVERGEEDGETVQERTLPVYDASVFVGLKTKVYDAAIERVSDAGTETVELPKMPELLASAAVARCLMPIKLRGHEIKAMRRIMKLTLAELAKKLDERTAAETVSRWESEAQPMGNYAEKLLRFIVCDELKQNAPGIPFNASTLVRLSINDPWRKEPDYQVPPIELWLLPLIEQSGSIIEAWNEKKAA
jgi:DNA-binding transcriptional regulator YiaG